MSKHKSRVATQVAANIETFVGSQYYANWAKGRAMRDTAKHFRFLKNEQTKEDIFNDLIEAMSDAAGAKPAVLTALAAEQMIGFILAMSNAARKDGTLYKPFPVPGVPADKPAEAGDLE